MHLLQRGKFEKDQVDENIIFDITDPRRKRVYKTTVNIFTLNFIFIRLKRWTIKRSTFCNRLFPFNVSRCNEKVQRYK